MDEIRDWGRRKTELCEALRRVPYLPHETDEVIYRTQLEGLGVQTRQDMSILISIVQDAIMNARREERPITPLDTFLDWLRDERDRICDRELYD